MFVLVIINVMMNLKQFGLVVLICVETNWPGSRFARAILGCRSLLLVNNINIKQKHTSNNSIAERYHLFFERLHLK